MLSRSTWEKLGGCAPPPTGLVALRLHPESRFNVFAALDGPTGHRLLLLKSAAHVAPPARTLPAGRGFEVRFAVTPSDPEGVNCVTLELTDPAYADVFDVIGNDILRGVIGAADDGAALAGFIERIRKWQQFLDQLGTDRLSEQAQQGLFAELWFLTEFLIGEVGGRRAVEAWAGPKRLAKDFQFRGLAFEVKASAAKQHTRFSISNEQQLDVRGSGRLILCGVLLERLVADGISLPEMVVRIRTVLDSDPDAAGLFAERLLETGYMDSDAGAYTARFSLRSLHFYDVRDAFPRIVESDLRPGVGDVRYSILSSECERYSIGEEEARRLLRAAP